MSSKPLPERPAMTRFDCLTEALQAVERARDIVQTCGPPLRSGEIVPLMAATDDEITAARGRVEREREN